MADQAALTDIEGLIQGAAFAALSPWSDPDNDDWRDQAADQVRDAVLTALDDNGLSIVLTDDVALAVDVIDAQTRKLSSAVNLVKGIPCNTYAEGKDFAGRAAVTDRALTDAREPGASRDIRAIETP